MERWFVGSSKSRTWARGEYQRQIETSLLPHRQLAHPLAQLSRFQEAELRHPNRIRGRHDPGSNERIEVRFVDLARSSFGRQVGLLAKKPQARRAGFAHHAGVWRKVSASNFEQGGFSCSVWAGHDEPAAVRQ